jgi:DNA-directed RNA polymerase II subunit RPB2
MDPNSWKDAISWKIIDTYFKDNPNNLVEHHLASYNSFFEEGIIRIFRDNNPIRFIERETEDVKKKESSRSLNEAFLYLGGKAGTKIYYGKPVIYDEFNAHYMYPNDARLRNMTYGITIHYDVDIEMKYNVMNETGVNEIKVETMTLEKIYLGRFPIMLQSNLCILKSLSPDVRYNMGECRNDYGGYFIIEGKEKSIIPQEKFADNMLYIRANKEDDIYSNSAEIRSVSEDPSKPIRTTAVRIVAPSSKYTNQQIVVAIPNVRKAIPLFILMRALGVVSDKQIIETCLLDLEKSKDYIDLFIPSIHDANHIFNQETALQFIATFTKRRTVNSVLDILMNYFLPHIGEMNFLDKAYFVGLMVNKLLRVFTKEEKPTDRDSFLFKRIEQSGNLIYDLFREYFLIQNRAISLAIDSEYFYNQGSYEKGLSKLFENNYENFFKERIVESGFKKAFKGNWGSQENTKRLGVVQDLNRLSWNSFISQLRKINLPLDTSAKVVGPRHLHGSQWGYIDPVDTPDGGNIGLHKHMAISSYITSGYSSFPIIEWLRKNTPLKLLQECTTNYLSRLTKLFVNGNWIGVVPDPIEVVDIIKLFRRNGIIPLFTSIRFDYSHNEIYIYTDAGRLCRPIFYVQDGNPSYHDKKEYINLLNSGKATWEQLTGGFKKKSDETFQTKKNRLYEINELYSDSSLESLGKYSSFLDYIDTSEEETSLIAMSLDDLLKKNKYFTHLEIDPSLILGVMGNMIIFPDANPYPRDAFSCGQSKQAVSLYHSNYQMRIDKTGVVLINGQVPLVKSRYLEYINQEKQPYGVNAMVAIMSYTGYNVEDAILINKGSIDRGLFRTTYYSMYETREESTKVSGSMTNSVFADVINKDVDGIKPEYDYSHLDKWGLIKEETPLDDKIILIGKMTSSGDKYIDSSITPKKGQLGFVDKSFITEGEEGFRIAKVRIREERIPAIGDKMASRAGQKGTIGLIIPEEDMPYTEDGLRPDLIINPHALPSRMTIGQLIETLLGKVCCNFGGYGDCTAFATKGSNAKLYGEILTKSGFHSSGNQVLYNGMTGEQLTSDIFIGPTYYMRLKHMVKDKINYRARGARTALTRQTVQGRANDGGLRIGEMERDGVISHGMSHFLTESFMERGDEYYMAVCNKTGMIAVYNKPKNLFLSPSADGPIHFHTSLDGNMNIEMLSRFGRSFSIVRIPYSLKLLIHELQCMNVQMRIITEDNVDQLMNMSYSNQIMDKTRQELNLDEESILDYLKKYKRRIERMSNDINSKPETAKISYGKESDEVKSEIGYPSDASSAYNPLAKENSEENKSDASLTYNPLTNSEKVSDSIKQFTPHTPEEPPPPIKIYSPHTPSEGPSTNEKMDFGDTELNNLYVSLPTNSKMQIASLDKIDAISILKKVLEKKLQKAEENAKLEKELIKTKPATAILELESEKKEDDETVPGTETGTEDSKIISSSSSSVIPSSDSSSSSSSEIKKIIL